jgi:hypothetical protein
MNWLLALVLILLSSPAFAQAPVTWPGCSDPVPAPAAAFGYNTEIFCDHFAAGLPTIDKNNVCGSTACTAYQYSWFAHSGWPGGLAQGGANGFWCCTQVNSPTWFSNYSGGGGSGLTYNVQPPGMPIAGGGGELVSCATNGQPNQWYGIAIPAASFVRWELFTDPSNGGGTATALWMFPTEYLAAPAPGINFAEPDNTDGGAPTVYYWSAGGVSTIPATQGPGAGYVPSDHVISSFLVKAADNGGTGLFRWYKSDPPTQLGSQFTWNHTEAADIPGLIEYQHNCLLIQGPLNVPVNVKSVQVFSKYALTPGVSTGPAPLFGGGR